MKEKVSFKIGQAVEAFCVIEEKWLPAQLTKMEGNSYTVTWDDKDDAESELGLLDIRHCRFALSTKERKGVAREVRLGQLRGLLPLILTDLHDPNDIYMVWRFFRIADGIALDPEDPDFLEGTEACVANSFDVCQSALEEADGQTLPLHKLAGVHAHTFGVGSTKFLGMSFQEFVKSHFALDESSKMVRPLGGAEEVRAAKRQKLDSDRHLANALVRFLHLAGGTSTINKALLEFPEVCDAFSDVVSKTQKQQKIRHLVRCDNRFNVSKSGRTITLAS